MGTRIRLSLRVFDLNCHNQVGTSEAIDKKVPRSILRLEMTLILVGYPARIIADLRSLLVEIEGEECGRDD